MKEGRHTLHQECRGHGDLSPQPREMGPSCIVLENLNGRFGRSGEILMIQGIRWVADQGRPSIPELDSVKPKTPRVVRSSTRLMIRQRKERTRAAADKPPWRGLHVLDDGSHKDRDLREETSPARPSLLRTLHDSAVCARVSTFVQDWWSVRVHTLAEHVL